MKTLLLLSLLLVSSVHAQTTLRGEASKLSWGGHWWTMRGGELALGWDDGKGRGGYSVIEVKNFDACLSATTDNCKEAMNSLLENKGKELSPLMKFDLWVKNQVDAVYAPGSAISMYSRATLNELKIHYITGPEHRHYNSRFFAGKCTGWSLSNLDFPEPTMTKTIDGITFTPADIKGILAAIYYGAQFFVPEEMALGNAFRSEGEGHNDAYYSDPAPHELINAFEKHIKTDKKIVVADMDPTEGVWNHPIYSYSAKLEAPRDNKVKGNLVVKYAKDEVRIDEVFTTQGHRPDLIERSLDFELIIPTAWDKKISSIKQSVWLGDSVQKHPDSLIFGLEKDWRKNIYKYKDTQMKLEVNFQLIKKVNLGGGYKVIVDELLKKYYAK